MKKALLGICLAAFSLFASATTFNPIQLLNPAGSVAGQAIVSTGPSTVAAWGGVGVNGIAAIAANTVLANGTGSSASPTAFAMPACSTASSALQWTSGTGFTCGTVASAGANSNITSLSGLTTPLSVAQGGIGIGTLAANSVLLGNGTSALATAAPGVSGTLFASNGVSSNPTFQTALSLGLLYDNTVINVKSPTYGALGNSNGTHGNGNDDTSAIQSAMNAATGGSLMLPCGTYRITATITTTDGKPRYIYGHGICTKIFNDAASAQPTFSFAPSSGTCSSAQLAPCLVMQGLNFLPPNVVGGAQSAVSLTNTNAPLFANNTFNGQNAGVALVTSFAPRIIANQFISGAYGVYSVDTSANGAEIASNGFYGMSAAGINIAPASSCAEATSIRNNDIEQNAIGITLGGLCGGSVADNYIESSHTQTTVSFTGTTNSAIEFHGNNFNAATDTSTGTISIAHIANANFQRNYFLNATVSYGTGATLTHLRAVENTLTTATLPATTVACTGLGTGGTCAVTGDDYSGLVALTTGSASTGTSGTVTLTLTNAIGTNGSSCTWTPVAGTANWSTPTFLVSSATTTSNQVTWTNSTNLTVSKIYQLSYTCVGY